MSRAISPRRILVHDYAGHPFQVQLSREPAARGHTVLHVHSASVQTPQGALARRGDETDRFGIQAIALSATNEKAANIRRYSERRYGVAKPAGMASGFGRGERTAWVAKHVVAGRR